MSHWLAGVIESKTGARCELRCLCDDYLPFFHTIAYNPLSVLGVALLVWIIFIAIFGPLWLASFAISTWGALLLLLVGIVWLARFIARSMAFPGAVKSMQRSFAQSFIKRNSEQLEELASTAATFTKQLMLVASNRLSLGPGDISFESMNDLCTGSAFLASQAAWMREAADEELAIERSEQMTAEVQVELEPCQKLMLAAEALAIELRKLYNVGTNSLRMSNETPAALLAAAAAANTAAAALQKAACAARPSALELSSSSPAQRGGVDLSGGGLMSVLQAVWDMNKGPSGSARLSYGIMRAQLKSVFHAERALLTGRDGNTIDVMYVPNIRSATARSQQQQPEADGSPIIHDDISARPPQEKCAPSKVGTVFLCGPNAGLYELISQTHQDASWFGFYQRLGFDVCLWNYRGYNSSTGTPSPDALKQDAEVIIRYLREERGINDLLVHGESIGGMVGCHVAAHAEPPPRLLVADRTFASLDAVAEKLLGKWASFGLRYLGLWNTNVVADYSAAACEKVLIQDPADSIIHNTASLKNGLSTHVLLGDTDWYSTQLPAAYRKAELLKSGIQSVPVDAHALLDDARTSGIHEAFVVHLCACIQDIATRAAQDLRVRKAWRLERDRAIETAELASAGAGAESAYPASPASSTAGVQQIPPLPPLPPQSVRTLSEIEACTGDTFNAHERIDFTTRAKGTLDGALQGCDSELSHPFQEGEGSVLDDLQAFAPPTGGAGGGESSAGAGAGGEMGARARSRSSSADLEDVPVFLRTSGGHGTPSRAAGSGTCSSSSCGGLASHSASLQAPQLSPLERAWMLLCRADGGSGSSLIQAWCHGFGGLRAWVCSVVVWSARAAVYKDYEKSKAASLFVGLGQVSKELSTMIHKQQPGASSALSQLSSLVFVQEAFAMLATRAAATDIPEGQGPLLGHKLGLVVPVDCGHNGWPGKPALQAVTQCVHRAKFNMITPDSAGARSFFPLAASAPKTTLQPARGTGRAGFVVKEKETDAQSNQCTRACPAIAVEALV